MPVRLTRSFPFVSFKRTLADEIQRRGYSIVLLGADGFMPSAQFTGTGGPLERDLRAAVFLYSAVTANAEAAASLSGLLRRKDPGGYWVASNESFGLLSSPCIGACARLTWRGYVEMVALQLFLRGRAYARIVRALGEVRLEPYNPDEVTVVRDAAWRVTEYIVRGARIPPEDMLHISLASPDVISDGMSPFVAAQRTVTIDSLAHERQAYLLQNKAEAGMVVTVQGGLSLGVDEDGLSDLDRFKSKLKTEYQAAARTGDPLVVGGNVTIADSPEQARGDYLDLRRWTREEVMALTRTPPPILGVYDNATLANFAQAIKIWWSVGLEPLLQDIYGAINAQVIAPEYGASVQVWYDLSSSQLALDLLRERIDLAGKLVNDLGYPANAAARRVGLDLEHYPELDLPNVKFTVAGRTDPNAPALALPADGAADEAPATEAPATDAPADLVRWARSFRIAA